MHVISFCHRMCGNSKNKIQKDITTFFFNVVFVVMHAFIRTSYDSILKYFIKITAKRLNPPNVLELQPPHFLKSPF